MYKVGEELLEVDTRVIPGLGKGQYQRARAHLFYYPWMPAFAGMTGEGDPV